MAKCEHHDEFIKLLETVKEYITVIEKNMCQRIDNTDARVDRIRDDVDKQAREHTETKAYVNNCIRSLTNLHFRLLV